MLTKMGMGHMMPGGSTSGGGKVNVNAMKANLDRNLKAAKNKERLLSNLEKRKAEQQQAQQTQAQQTQAQQTQQQAQQTQSHLQSVGVDAEGRESLVFSKGEQVERSAKPSDTPSKTSGAAKKKKNKNKNKNAEAVTAE